MQIVMLYDPKGEFATKMDEFTREAQRRYPNFKPQVISTESKEGADLAAAYDITRYPAILVKEDSGELAQMWQGSSLPLIDDVVGYLVG